MKDDLFVGNSKSQKNYFSWVFTEWDTFCINYKNGHFNKGFNKNFLKWWNYFVIFLFLALTAIHYLRWVQWKCWQCREWLNSDSAWQAEENPYCWSLSSERHRITLYWIQPDSSTPYLSCGVRLASCSHANPISGRRRVVRVDTAATCRQMSVSLEAPDIRRPASSCGAAPRLRKCFSFWTNGSVSTDCIHPQRDFISLILYLFFSASKRNDSSCLSWWLVFFLHLVQSGIGCRMAFHFLWNGKKESLTI